ncbi:hypothetical protein D918_02773 [Trichuris suis]|nr:hypothetical protein D918_02773 [Trichuris suis]
MLERLAHYFQQVADPRGEKAMQKIMERFGNFLYPTNQNQNSSELETWDDAEKTTAATNVFYMLLGKLDQSQKFDFSELIAGSKCIAQSGEKHVIMHLKLLRHGKCHKVPFFHRCPSEQNVYCTWSGTLHESMLNKTDGYLCFESNEVSKETVFLWRQLEQLSFSNTALLPEPLNDHHAPSPSK